MNYICEEKRPTIICLTPVKNEAWILDRFLKCASLWADHIIIADQQSTDGSREIAARYPKVTLIDNTSPTFNEPERQKLLLEAARNIPGSRLLIALDADEILSANFMNSPEWNTLLQATPGTVITIPRINLQPGGHGCWEENIMLFGLMDDGSEHIGKRIHSPRIPHPLQAPTLILQDIKVLHYQYINWERMQSKHRWYQCWEILNQNSQNPIDIYREYHHMYAVPKDKIHSIPREWFLGYEKQEIDMTSISSESIFWWDRQILEWLDKYGTETFKKIDIWDVDWTTLSKKISQQEQSYNYQDPRNRFDKYIHTWLRKTQKNSLKLHIRLIDKVLIFLNR